MVGQRGRNKRDEGYKFAKGPVIKVNPTHSNINHVSQLLTKLKTYIYIKSRLRLKTNYQSLTGNIFLFLALGLD